MTIITRTAKGSALTFAEMDNNLTELQASISAVVAPSIQTGTTYSPVLADKDRLVGLSNTSAITLTIPANVAVAFPVGTTLTFAQNDVGTVTIVPASGVTINKNARFTLIFDGQYAVAQLTKTAVNTWILSGQMVAA